MILNIPEEFSNQSDQLALCIKSALQNENITDDEIKIIRPQIKNLSPGDFGEIMIYLGSGAAIWFTDKWVETYLWPEIDKKIGNKSKALVNWLLSKTKSGG